MMRNEFVLRKRITTAGALLIVFVVACATSTNFVRTEPREQVCADYPIMSQDIKIEWNKSDRILLGRDPQNPQRTNTLIVPKGALPNNETRTYRVDPIFIGSERAAGVSFAPTDGHISTEFEEPLELHLTYRGCDFEDHNGPFVIVKTENMVKRPIGGAKIKNKKEVRALVDSFSKFAIAIN